MLLVPSFKLRATFGFHAVGVVVMLVGHGAHVLLQGGDVEKMRKEPLGFLLQSKGLGKRG